MDIEKIRLFVGKVPVGNVARVHAGTEHPLCGSVRASAKKYESGALSLSLEKVPLEEVTCQRCRSKLATMRGIE